ncbi:MAG TPA: tRNA uridine-5-carboxymethylaminomethyl(34) synthesis GTPase MnmE [Crocinitomix sp.]|nr:tRNA uridine-5-carboxymethylaminomethyl(34) synthesis GTPase MnmE [Crocinitomix sp.]
MKHNIEQDTICALATANGIGAIAIIRVSGNNAIKVVEDIFSKPLIDKDSHTAHFGLIKNGQEIIDEALVTIFKNPKSFTGEDSVEISCHASPYIQQEIIHLLLKKGVRMAKAGEFSMRAFINGKMDLSQTEAIADLIASTSKIQHQVALNQMRGGFSSDLQSLRQQLLDFASLIELELDFSEEDVEFADRSQLENLINEIKLKIKSLLDSFKLGNVIKNGVPVAIIGRPNAGKSTLLNAILNDDRAIVSQIAGTTRDTIEEKVVINGVEFRFIDTAGLRQTTDEIEKIGVEKALKELKKSFVYIYLFDMNELNIDDVLKDLSTLPKTVKRIVVANKLDIVSDDKLSTFSNSDLDFIGISAKQNKSIELLKDKLVAFTHLNQIDENQSIVTNVRHYEALNKSYMAIEKVEQGLQNQITGDFLAMDIREILEHLGEITGSVSNDELLGNIFANFCIGK